jgi:hypothetical protein
MKRLSAVGFVLLFLGVAGCQNDKTVQVLAGDQGFPESLAGQWRAYRAGWEFVMEPDGTITSAVIDNGLARVDPRKKTAEAELADGGKGFYQLGEWVVQYSPDGRELSITVVVDYLHLDMGDWGMKGNSRDLFVGPVSEDWQNWTAQWFSFSEITAFSTEKDGEEVVFTPDEVESLVDTLVFDKIADQ